MKTPACVLILLRLHVLVRPSDFSVFIPQIPHVPIPNHQTISERSFIDNKPFLWPTVSPSPPKIEPYTINTGGERDSYNQTGPYPVDSNVLRRPPLYNAHRTLHSSFQYQPSPEIYGSLNKSPPLERGKYNPLYNAHKTLHSSFQYQPSPEIYGSLNKSPPLERGKYNPLYNAHRTLHSSFQYQPSPEIYGSLNKSPPLERGKYNPLYNAHKTLHSSFQYQPSPEIHGSLLYKPPPLEPGKYNPLYNAHKTLHSSFQYQPSPEIHGSLLYKPSPLEREKYNYGLTTVKNAIQPSPDHSILPSRGTVVDGSESTTEHLNASVSKPVRENKVPTNVTFFDKFILSLDGFENKFFKITFNKLLSIGPPSRLENGISFAQSGLFLYLALMALSTEVDSVSSAEINSNLRLQSSDSDKIKLLRQIVSWLPPSSSDLKFRWATRLVLEPRLAVSQEFLNGSAAALRLQMEWLNGTETLGNLTKTLNSRIETDSGGAMRNTFDEDDFDDGACSILLNTIYIRARWRSPPTVLNGTRPFRDSERDEPERSVKMIRINDVMRYATLKEWNAEALEIRYATRDLTLLLLVPEGHTLKSLASNITTTSLRKIEDRMRTMRLAAILPIYTLRMTLLLPGKLQEMGISRLVETNNTQSSGCGQLRLSHAVQRIMFWAEAGRNAYKDDGIEWDEAPEKEIMVDRPYIFYVRWKNVTLMNGNFVL